MRFEGTVKTWNDDRGFGFIEPAQGGQEIFLHIKAFDQRAGRPQPGQRVVFEVELGPQGKKRACRVEPVRIVRSTTRPRREPAARWGTATLFAIPAFIMVFIVASAVWPPPHWVAVVYLGASGLSFVAYALDKAAAVRGQWRTPEATLHALALAGGWPGALLAQQFLRHKSTKAEFRAVFWVTAVLNTAAFVALCTLHARGAPLS
jgi:uncharacterized membrane protein YsdA (DUF1294 family)/cold shock CspA family protein